MMIVRRSLIAIILLLFLLLISSSNQQKKFKTPPTTTATTSTDSYDYQSYDDTEDTGDETSSSTNGDDLADNKSENKDSKHSDDYYYDDEYNYDDSDSADSDSKLTTTSTTTTSHPPHPCPAKCKCEFIKPSKSDDTSEYVDDYSSSTDSNNNYDDYYSSSDDSSKNRFHVDLNCANKSISTINYLFDDDFPIDQIIKFNLSSNKIKQLRLNDGFEDLVSIELLDLSSNRDLRVIPFNFIKNFNNLKTLILNDLSLKCDCKMKKLFSYLKRKQITVKTDDRSVCYDNKEINLSNIESICKDGAQNNRLKLEPNENQLVFEGDSLTLKCSIGVMSKRFTTANIKWLFNNTDFNKSIGNYKINLNRNYNEIEIKDVNKNENMGKYRCALNTNPLISSNEISVNVIEKAGKEAKTIQPIIGNKFCPEMITKTYKGTYKWNKTAINVKQTQKCVRNPLKLAEYECNNQSNWVNLDLKQCDYESNLTNYLNSLLKSLNKNNQTIFNDIIKVLLKQSQQDVNVYDLTIITRLLDAYFDIQNEDYFYKFVWFIDYILTQFDYKLLFDAQSIDNSLSLINVLLNRYRVLDKNVVNLSSFVLFKHNLTLNSSFISINKSKYTQKLMLNEEIMNDYELAIEISEWINKTSDLVYFQYDYLDLPNVNSTYFSKVVAFNRSLLTNNFTITFKLHSIKRINDEKFELDKQLIDLNTNLFDKLFSSTQIKSINKKIWELDQQINPNSYVLHRKRSSNEDWFATDECKMSLTNSSQYYFLKSGCNWNESVGNNDTSDSYIYFKLVYTNSTIKAGHEIVELKAKFNEVVNDYRVFNTKIIYFSSIFGIFLLLITIIVYLIKGNSVLMPRRLRHILINMWICIFMQLLIYLIGYLQVDFTLLCVTTAFLLHIFVLSTYFWYNLYYFHLYKKLNRLKENNIRLNNNNNNNQTPSAGNRTTTNRTCVFNKLKCKQQKQQEMSKFENEDDFGEDGIDDLGDGDEYVEKPVIQLYMYAYGVSTFICSIGFALSKRYYIYGTNIDYCFMNHYQTIFSTFLLPIVLTLLFNLIFIVLITLTVRQIMKEFNNESEKEDEQNSNQNGNDVDGICENGDDGDNRSLAQSILSSVTSVMDTQYKPQIQVLISIIGFVIYTCILLSVYFQHSGGNGLVSEYACYVYSFFTIIYSIKIFAFYMLTRDDLLRNCCCVMSLDAAKLGDFKQEIPLEDYDLNNYDAIETVNECNENYYVERDVTATVIVETVGATRTATTGSVIVLNECDEETEINQNEENVSIIQPTGNPPVDDATLTKTPTNSQNNETEIRINDENDTETIQFIDRPSASSASSIADENKTLTPHHQTPSQPQSHNQNQVTPKSTQQRKSHHVRNASTLSGQLNEQQALLNCLYDSTLNNDEQQKHQSMSSSSSSTGQRTNKKPLYVYIDHSYPQKPTNNEQPHQKYTPNRKQQSTTIIESINTLTNTNTQIINSNLSLSSVTKSMSTPPLTSSSISSNVSNNEIICNSCVALTGNALNSLASIDHHHHHNDLMNDGASKSPLYSQTNNNLWTIRLNSTDHSTQSFKQETSV